MRTDARPEGVRRLVRDVLEQLDAIDARYGAIDETILIDGRRCVARSYRVEGYLAMWLVEVGIVQFYDAEGRMLATINLFREIQPERMAA